MRWTCFLTMLAMMTLLGACGEPVDSPQSEQRRDVSRTLRLNIGGEPSAMDPALVEDVVSHRVAQGLLEGLVWLDGRIRPQPGVAASWEPNEDYTKWTFHLRPDARWSNGDPVTAHDFKYGAERVCTPSTGAGYAQIVYSVLKGGQEYFEAGGLDAGESLEAIHVIDDHTIEYEMAHPAPFFISLVAFAPWMPVHRATVEEHGARWCLSPETYVGNGPFRMTAYRSRDRIDVAKSDTYWDRGNIFWDRVIIYMIDNEMTEDQAFRAGELDISYTVPTAQVHYWRERPEYLPTPSLWTYYLVFNTEVPPFDNALVRKAFRKAIDRDLIVNRVTQGNEVVAGGMVPIGMPSAREDMDYRDAAGDMVGPRDLEEARRLMAEAGYGPEGRAFPPVEYLIDSAELHRKIGEQLQNMWREAFNIDVRLQTADWGVYLGRVRGGDYQFARANWIGDYADPLNFLEIFESPNSKNSPNFKNARYDELIAKARAERDPIQREDYFIEAERILVEEEAAIAPLFFQQTSMLVQPDIENLDMNALGNLIWFRARRAER